MKSPFAWLRNVMQPAPQAAQAPQAKPSFDHRSLDQLHVELTIAEHMPDGSTLQHVLVLSPTSVGRRVYGDVAVASLYLPLCSECSNALLAPRRQPTFVPAAPNAPRFIPQEPVEARHAFQQSLAAASPPRVPPLSLPAAAGATGKKHK